MTAIELLNFNKKHYSITAIEIRILHSNDFFHISDQRLPFEWSLPCLLRIHSAPSANSSAYATR